MRFLKILFLYVLPGVVSLFALTTAIVLWQLNMLNSQGIREAQTFIAENNLRDVYYGVMGELNRDHGATDSSFGRREVAGRGHTPWVIRSNLDGHPRMINFALAPELWASYDTQTGQLYQVWEGDILFEGATYDYRHGPQPSSPGKWLYQAAVPAEESVRYLGHRFSDGGASVSFSYESQDAEGQWQRVTERPEILEEGGKRYLQRNITRAVGETINASVELVELVELSEAQPLQAEADINMETSESEISRGEQVVLNGDCVGCHNVSDQVVGPAYARIAKKFRGRMQENVVDALATSIIDGSVGTWGQVPMPAHPDMSREDARLAAMYILTTGMYEAEQDVPLDSNGQPYVATREYDIGPRLDELHPSFRATNILPEGFQPKVGGMAFRSDGNLLISSWDLDGGVFLLDTSTQPAGVTRIADGLQEPLGLTLVDDRLFVLQKQELTELIDHDGDEIIDEYRTVSNQWPTTSNFHSFAFGLVYKQGYFYGLLSICVQPGGASCPEQLPSQGKLIRISLEDGSVDYVASGFRTPNGIALGANGDIWVNDNQGDWLPASKLMHVEEGKFYGSRAVPFEGVMNAKETPPAVWMPQDQIGNSPTEPIWLEEGPFAGQLLFGDVYQGGIQRASVEKVDGAWQGAIMRFTGGLSAGVNRIQQGPDGKLYIGEIGNPGNWGEIGKQWHGLETLEFNGDVTFELFAVRATPTGFQIELTAPLADATVLKPSDLTVRQWFYYPNEQYGGPMYDAAYLVPDSLSLSADRKTITADISGLNAGYVVYLALDPSLQSSVGDTLWVNEAWYTLNSIPTAVMPLSDGTDIPPNTLSDAEKAAGWELMFDGENFGHWRNYGAEGVEKWVI